MSQLRTEEFLPLGLLALAPLLLVIDSTFLGVGVGLLLILILMFNLALILPIRNLVPAQFRLLVALIMNSTVVIVLSLVLQAKAYAFIEHIGLLFPLLAINSLVMSYGELLFIGPELKTALSRTLLLGLLLVLLLTMYGGVREFLISFSLLVDVEHYTGFAFAGFQLAGSNNGIPVFNTTAGVLFLLGVLVALYNLFNRKPDAV